MTSSEKEYTHLFKILLIGNSSVGKSSLLLRFVDDAWSDIFVPTIGVDFKVRTLKINNSLIKFQIWDTAGQERFKNITANYYRGAHGILVLYDITDVDSFKNLNNWLMEIEKNAKSNVVKVLIGNKSDLSSLRKVSVEEGEEFAEENGMKFIETSAKNRDNVLEAFEELGREIMEVMGEDDKMNLGSGSGNKGVVSIGKNTRGIDISAQGKQREKEKEKGC